MINDGVFRKSTFSGGGGCVEVSSRGNDSIFVRDSKAPESGTLQFNSLEWQAFIDGARAGQFDL
jgi:hypothetical protein